MSSPKGLQLRDRGCSPLFVGLNTYDQEFVRNLLNGDNSVLITSYRNRSLWWTWTGKKLFVTDFIPLETRSLLSDGRAVEKGNYLVAWMDVGLMQKFTVQLLSELETSAAESLDRKYLKRIIMSPRIRRFEVPAGMGNTETGWKLLCSKVDLITNL